MSQRKFLFVFLLMAVSVESQGLTTSVVPPMVGGPAFDFQLTDMSGQRLTLSSLKGKAVVLDFWTTWCPPCREELPIIDQVAKSFLEKPVAVLGIDALEDPETVRQFLQTYPVSFRTLLTFDDGSTLDKYGANSFPLTVVIDRNGIVVDASYHEAKDLNVFLREKLNSVLRADYQSPGAPPAAEDEPLAGFNRPNAPDVAPAAPTPRAPDELFLRASLDLRMNRLAEALHDVNACLDQSKDWIPALRLRASVHSRQGKRNEAVADYTRILSKSPNEAEIYGLRAGLYRELAQSKQALEDYRRQTSLDPHDAEGWLHVAGLYLADSQLNLARKAIDRGIALVPDNAPAYQMRAQIEEQNADWKGELADIDRMLILEPNNNWAKTYRPDVVLRIARAGRPILQDDTYAVYSAVLLHPIWDHIDDDKLLLISGITGATYGGMDPARCIRSPAAYQKQLDQALSDYAARKTIKVQLRPELQVTRPYRLLSDKESEQFVNLRFRGTAPDPSVAGLFAKTPDLIRLSQVFFDGDHTLALVLVSNYCGGLCGGEEWRVLRSATAAGSIKIGPVA